MDKGNFTNLRLLAILFFVLIAQLGGNFNAAAAEGTLKWSYATGAGILSSPAIDSDGTIYVGSGDNKLYAFNSDGTLKWSYITGGDVSISSPAIGSDGTIYLGGVGNKLYALNSDGTLKWSYSTGGTFVSSPAIASDGTIYVGTESEGKLYAINSNGTLKWFYTAGSHVYVAPVIGSDGTIYVGSYYNHLLHAVNPNGTVKWTYDAGGDIGATSLAIGSDGTIYVGTLDEAGTDRSLHAVNPNGTKKWSFPTGKITASPVIDSDGTIYVGSLTNNNLYAFNPDGTLKWSYLTGNMINASAAVGSDGTIYIGSMDGKLYALNSNGTLKWSYTSNAIAYSSPAIGQDGTVYIGSTDNKLYAINGSGRLADTPWPMFHHDLRHTGNVTAVINTTYVLTVTKSGSGSGTVTSSDGGIDCGSSCSKEYDSGESVTLTATQDSGSSFTGWSGGGCSGVGECTITMNEAITVSGIFDDTTPPNVSIVATPNILWPPNHKMVDVRIDGSATDVTSGIASVVITVSDEYGIYNMPVSGFGSTIQLEAWRDGSDKDGRVYTITVIATDMAGNQSTATTMVTVPHDMRK